MFASCHVDELCNGQLTIGDAEVYSLPFSHGNCHDDQWSAHCLLFSPLTMTLGSHWQFMNGSPGTAFKASLLAKSMSQSALSPLLSWL